MTDHVYKQIELTGSSPTGIDDAIRNAVKKAGESIKHMNWFNVVETRGHIDGADVKHWQVTIKIGFTIED